MGARLAGAGELGLRLAAGLWRFWLTWGYLTEGQRWLDRLLSAGGACAAGLAREGPERGR